MKFCTHCGKEIADEAVICLNCGCKTQNGNTFISSPTTAPIIVEEAESQLATWAKICGIVSFFIGWFALGITAIVLAQVSKDDTNGVMCPAAKTGYVCGIISTVLSLLLFVVIVSVLTAIAL